MATACAWTITLLYIYLCVWWLDLRLNNINYSCWYFSSSVSHHILVLNLWNTIQLKYHNQWVSYLWYSSSPHTALVITDASIKNDIATSISHIHSMNSLLTKTVHHALFVTSTEAELFAIRCGINQACSKDNVSKIIVVTDSIHAAKKIFNGDSHSYQLHSIAILREL